MSRRPALRTLRARSEEPAEPAHLSGAAYQWQSAEQMHRLPELGEESVPAYLRRPLPGSRPVRPMLLQLGEGERSRQRYHMKAGSPAVSPLSTPGDERPLPGMNGSATEEKPPHGAGRAQQRRRSSHLYLEMAARMSCSEPTLDNPALRTQQARIVNLQVGATRCRGYIKRPEIFVVVW